MARSVRQVSGSDDTPTLVEIRRGDASAAIVLIHGFGGNTTQTFGNMGRFLTADRRLDGWDLYSLGYHTRLAPDIRGMWSGNPSLTLLSAYLAGRVATPPLDRYRALALVAHSMGGLIVQRALLDSDIMTARTSHVFLFGTPSAGLHKARPFAWLQIQITDMKPGGKFITALRADWANRFDSGRPFQLWVLPGLMDQFVGASSSTAPFPTEVIRPVPGNHLQIVRPESADSESVQAVVGSLVADAAPAGPWNSALVAVETQDFKGAIDRLLPNAHRLDDTHLVELALALDSVGRRDEAISVLDRDGLGLDALGVLAGRLKRRWMVEGVKKDAREAMELYDEGYRKAVGTQSHGQAYYHGINLAFMHLAFREDPRRAEELAGEVLPHCQVAEQTVWRAATMGEAQLYRSDVDSAVDAYLTAMALAPSPRQAESIYQQASWIVRLKSLHGAQDRLEAVFRPALGEA